MASAQRGRFLSDRAARPERQGDGSGDQGPQPESPRGRPRKEAGAEGVLPVSCALRSGPARQPLPGFQPGPRVRPPRRGEQGEQDPRTGSHEQQRQPEERAAGEPHAVPAGGRPIRRRPGRRGPSLVGWPILPEAAGRPRPAPPGPALSCPGGASPPRRSPSVPARPPEAASPSGLLGAGVAPGAALCPEAPRRSAPSRGTHRCARGCGTQGGAAIPLGRTLKTCRCGPGTSGPPRMRAHRGAGSPGPLRGQGGRRSKAPEPRPDWRWRGSGGGPTPLVTLQGPPRVAVLVQNEAHLEISAPDRPSEGSGVTRKGRGSSGSALEAESSQVVTRG